MAKPTINDVARIAGVSKKTVSRVINQSPLLNEVTRAKVEKVIAEIGYVPDPQARALALRRNVGGDPSPAPAPSDATASAAQPRRKLILLAYAPFAAPLLADVQAGIMAAIGESDFALAVRLFSDESNGLETEFRAFIELHRPSGVLLLPPLSELRTLTGLCREIGCPHICLGAGALDEPDNMAASDDRQAAAQAVAYLISLGHERIGMVTGPEDSRTAQERELGYLDAMADHDLDRGPALIAGGDNSFQSGFAAGQLLLEVSPRPTAIFAAGDDMAAGVLHAAAQKGVRVPEGLSIVGFEDTAIAARLYPQLTTIRVPFAEMAKAAAQRLMDEAAAEGSPARFTPELVVRASTGPCPA